VAPFLSGPRLWDEAGPATRALIDRLDGRTPLPGGAGDVLTDAARIRAPLLVIHGDADETIPIGQSRVLRDRLMRAGRRERVDFRLLEVRGAGHDPLHGPRGRTPTTVLTQFLTGAPVGSWISATVAEKSKSNNTKGGRS
jgi:pimeloyl-ACP methyl ester carboxylesterase